MSDMTAKQLPLSDDEVTRRLLIELLAYQFASPVQWVETQNKLLQGDSAVQRIVEIGPAAVLAGLAKRTADTKYGEFFAAQDPKVEVLSYAQDAAEICYEYEEKSGEEAVDSPINPTPSQPSESSPPAGNTESSVPAPPPQQPSASPAPVVSHAAKIDDAPVGATLMLHSLIAQKLQLPIEDISTERTVKDVSAGKSTLQNEIIGDLGNEFGSLPDSAEQLSIENLGAALASSFSGQPGKVSSTLLSKFVSSRMPAGFGNAAVREYLQSKWGLGPGRQTGVLLVAAASRQSARLDSTSAAEEFLDSAVQRYGLYVSITLSPASASSGSASGNGAGGSVDPAALKEITKGQNEMFQKQLEILAKHLGVDLSSDRKALDGLRSEQELAEQANALLSAELGDAFLDGIKPVFDAEKHRHYDSYWNWARQRLMNLVSELSSGRRSLTDPTIRQDCEYLANCAEPISIQQLTYQQSHTPQAMPKEEWARFCTQLKGRLLDALKADPVFRYDCLAKQPVTSVDEKGKIEYKEASRQIQHGEHVYYTEYVTQPHSSSLSVSIPTREDENSNQLSGQMTALYHKILRQACASGISFSGSNVLITGAGPGSIGMEVVRGLLEGGANVIVTTSRAPADAAPIFRPLYSHYGSRGSQLRIVQFNQGSNQDCSSLIEFIYSHLELDLDAVVPFAAIPEAGRQFDGLDGKSELAHRLMLTNTIRLLGHIKQRKEAQSIVTRPTQVLLPLSPNHGLFGGDGLYPESKLGLETLYNRWHSESWSPYLALTGAVIGWTRGTGLMSANNITAQAIESQGATTFSPREMACNLLSLMHYEMAEQAADAPLRADLTGGLHKIVNLKSVLTQARRDIMEQSEVRAAISREHELEKEEERSSSNDLETAPPQSKPKPLADNTFEFPRLPHYEKDIAPLCQSLGDMVDLSRVVVVVGYGELGPWGNSRTRWDIESAATFSREGWVEIAWMMGLIKHFNDKIKGKHFVGWVDTKTNEPVEDDDIESKYGRHIMENTGIRFVQPDLFHGYDPKRKEYYQEIAIDDDMPSVEASEETAQAFKEKHGEKADILEKQPGEWIVKLKKGATVYVPKSVQFDRLVAGQIPTGWNARTYGVPDEIAKNVDPVSLYALCCVSEALMSAGMKDPWELYEHVHVSEIAQCISSGAGGVNSLHGIYHDRFFQKNVMGDALQETFINTTAAWINMLLLGASGPTITPVAACATALESLHVGCETILRGNAKVAFVGGTEDFNEELSQEFANMRATSNAVDELAKGRKPEEMSRPTTTTRAGFMESHGAGVQIITTAELALEMGLPIHGVIAHTSMASDKIGRSVPAPGMGILTNAREEKMSIPSPMLDIGYRRMQKEMAESQILAWRDTQLQHLNATESSYRNDADDQLDQKRYETIEKTTARQLRDIRFAWGNNFSRQDPEVSPLRAALATWNLTIDDIGFVSFHGTSTKANDINEIDCLSRQFAHLGRSPGNAALGIHQKYLTGHALGGAGAWMLNGALQAQNFGLIPGNRNADNIDESFSRFEHLIFPNTPVRMPNHIKAFTLTSFGFGQKGAQVVVVHPLLLYATLNDGEDAYRTYCEKRDKRHRKIYTHYHEAMMSNTVFRAKNEPQYDTEDTQTVLLDPKARLRPGDDKIRAKRSIKADSTNTPPTPNPNEVGSAKQNLAITQLIQSAAAAGTENFTVGVDIEALSSFASHATNETFVTRNFTEREREYASTSPNSAASLCGRWCAKEAVFKSLRQKSKGAGAAMGEVEILTGGDGPRVELHGEAREMAKQAGVLGFNLSLSHSDETVIAVALACR